MAPKRNNMIPNVHLHKDWQRYVRTWFNQPARKQRRYNKRKALAQRVAPRPVGKLRPMIRCPTVRHNTKQRLGKGFTLRELRAVGLCAGRARTIGISVDYRRKNRTVESLQKNVQRLKEYNSKLIIFPKNNKKIKKTESSIEECKKAQQLSTKVVMPLRKSTTAVHARPILAKERCYSAFSVIRKQRKHAKNWGKRAKRAKEAAEDAAVTSKK